MNNSLTARIYCKIFVIGISDRVYDTLEDSEKARFLETSPGTINFLRSGFLPSKLASLLLGRRSKFGSRSGVFTRNGLHPRCLCKRFPDQAKCLFERKPSALSDEKVLRDLDVASPEKSKPPESNPGSYDEYSICSSPTPSAIARGEWDFSGDECEEF